MASAVAPSEDDPDSDNGSPQRSLPTTTAPAQAPPPPPPATQDISSLLTIVLTTSPTPSAPATDLVAAVLASFRAHCPALLACPIIVVFDTYDHIGPQLRLKKGCVTAVEAAHYEGYKSNVRQLVQDVWGRHAHADGTASLRVEHGLAEYGSPFIDDNAVKFKITHVTAEAGTPQMSFVEPEVRLGFGLGVRTAVRAASTPYVWVQQHDWTLAADVPLAAMLDVMRTSEANQASEAASHPGRDPLADADEAVEPDLPTSDGETLPEWEPDSASPAPDMEISLASSSDLSSSSTPSSPLPVHLPDDAVPVRYICLPSVRMLRYATSAHAVEFPVLRALTSTFKQSFPTSSTASPTATTTPAIEPSSGSKDSRPYRLPLTPLFFWHDKTHIASRSHYLHRVFSSRLALGRGDFIEDHIGQRARSQMKQEAAAWARWACWLYYPDEGNQLCLRHLQGRTWRGEQQERAIRDQYRQRNRSAASAAAAIAAEAAATASAGAGTGLDSGANAAALGAGSWDAMPFRVDGNDRL